MARLLRRQRCAAESRAHEELEQLRLQYVAREERYVLDGEREQLASIKRELDVLRSGAVYGAAAADASAAVAKSDITFPARAVAPGPPTPQHSQPEGADGSADTHTAASTPEHNELQRLQRERAELLGAGQYTVDHPIIRELDRMIDMLARAPQPRAEPQPQLQPEQVLV